jgi:HSP20 family protein
MKFFTPTIVALASVPATVHAWYMSPTTFFPSTSSILRRHQHMMDRMLQLPQQSQLTSPRYELVDNEEKFQLTIDVPGVKAEDLVVSLEEGFLTVRGHRTESDDTSRFKSQFFQEFSLGPAILVEQFTANLDNGVLVVTAPKDVKTIEENLRKIPIMQTKVDTKLPEEKPGEDVKVEHKESKTTPAVEQLVEKDIGDIGV